MPDPYREPRHTCPNINKAQSNLQELADLVSGHIKCLSDELEGLRSENEALREWGNAWVRRAEEAEKQAEELEKELTEAREVANA